MRVELGHDGSAKLTKPLRGVYVRQSFAPICPCLVSVSFPVSTYRVKDVGKLIVEVIDASTRVVSASATVPISPIVDNGWVTYKLPMTCVQGRRYELTVRSFCAFGSDVSLHYGHKSNQGYMFVGSKVVPNAEMRCVFEYNGDPFQAESPTAGTDETAQRIMFSDGKLSVVILNKDRTDLLAGCLAGLQSNGDMEIVIGDTGSTEETWSYYKSLPSSVKVVQLGDYHFSRNNNDLVRKHITGDIVLFLNNDVFLDCGAVDRMKTWLRVLRVGAVGLRLIKPRGVIDHDGQVLWSNTGLVVPDHLHINWYVDSTPDKDDVVQGVTAACMMTRRELFLQYGGFDERFEDVYQDCDYNMKLARDGWLAVCVRKISSLHVGSASRGATTSDRESVCRDRKKYLEKWKGFVCLPRPEVSIITCTNNVEAYTDFASVLAKEPLSLVELLPIDNRGNPMTITEALNLGASVARGKYFMYSHHDIVVGAGWVARVLKAVRSISSQNIGIVGFEGIAVGGIPYSCRHVKSGTSVRVQTLDELCVFTPRHDLRFDERFKFHYYGADLCLQAEAKGLNNYLIGVPVRHLSGGEQNIMNDVAGFKKEAQELRSKWADKDVWTTTTKFLDGTIKFMILPTILNKEVEHGDCPVL